MISQTPAYNLKAVLRETGLKADVLRAWERRYELPTPQRTPGGHRLYSEYDIETVKWLRARQAEGLSISHAVEQWKEMLEAGLDPLAQHPATTSSATTAQRTPASETRLEILRQNWLAANLAFDSLQADEILNQAFAIYPVETVCTHILQQGISEIGEYWVSNKASVQQEHFATAQARRRLETLISATPPPTRQHTIMIGCPSGEQHTLSLMLLNLFLRRRGMQVIDLGADIPTLQMAETAATIKPDLIVLSAQQLSTAASLRSALLALQGTGIPLAYGGLIFNRLPDLRQRMPAFFLGETLDTAVQSIESLVINPVTSSYPTTTTATGQTLSKVYNEKRLRIEATVFESLSKAVLRPEFIDVANSFFGNALSAALELGDPAFLDADLDWLKRLLTSRHMSAVLLIPYLTAYQAAFQKELGAAGTPVIEWIERYLAQNRAAQDE
jgi:methanogenic corrinoid protein MtbC1